MNSPDPRWPRLVSVARRAPVDPDVAAPFGFAGRVVAQAWAAGAERTAVVFERFAWRGFGVSCLVAMAVASTQLVGLQADTPEDPLLGLDPVAEVLAAL